MLLKIRSQPQTDDALEHPTSKTEPDSSPLFWFIGFGLFLFLIALFG